MPNPEAVKIMFEKEYQNKDLEEVIVYKEGMKDWETEYNLLKEKYLDLYDFMQHLDNLLQTDSDYLAFIRSNNKIDSIESFVKTLKGDKEVIANISWRETE